MSSPSICRYMTSSPVTVGPLETVAAARQLMRAHRIRHLPVVAGRHLIGIVSERDLQLLERFHPVEPNDDDFTVEDAMTRDVFAVPDDMPLGDVVATMAAHKYSSAVVTSGDTVVGIFTTVDALRSIHTLLDGGDAA